MSFYTERMEQLKMQAMREKHPQWIWNRSDTHVFLKIPEAHDAYTTIVEPGNSYSPGPGTYGVSTWVQTNGTLYATERMPLDAFTWHFEDGKYPVLISQWNAGGIRITSELFPWNDPESIDFRSYLRITMENTQTTALEATLNMVIRSFGAAGGPIQYLKYENGIVYINRAPLFYSEVDGQFGTVGLEVHQTDISTLLDAGQFPEEDQINDPQAWASGALRYHVSLVPGASVSYDFASHIHAECEMYTWLKKLTRPLGFDVKREEMKSRWDRITNVEIDVPDQRVRDAFYAQIAHLYMFSGKDSARIAPITYPIWWMRDSAYICTALEQAGLYDFGRRCGNYTARFKPGAGFGSEADLQGNRIWVISEHYMLTRDLDYLRTNYAYLRENAEEILQMCNTDKPLAYFCEISTHQTCNWPEIAFTCAPSKDGLCVGRMDFFYPTFYCNSFHYLGLRRAALCAEALGEKEDAKRYAAARDAMKAALKAEVPGHFAHIYNARSEFYDECHPDNVQFSHHDTSSAFYPGGWADTDDEAIIKEYNFYWDKARCPHGEDGEIDHDLLWTYMELGDARNRLILGQRERAWKIFDWFLNRQTCPGLYTWSESFKDENTIFLAWEKYRGWDHPPFVTPHGWTAALMLGSLRDCMVREDEKGNVFLGIGVPESWMDKPFSIKNFPTYHGEISYRYEPETHNLYVHLDETASCTLISRFPGEVNIVRE